MNIPTKDPPSSAISFWIFLSINWLAANSEGGTYYSDLYNRSWFDLEIAEDGRIQAYLRAGLYYGEEKGDPYSQVLRNFIEIDKYTGTLLIAFGVSINDFRVDGHIMTLTLESQGLRTGPPRNATHPKPDWFNDNMVIWFDAMERSWVMIYQEGCISCWGDSERDELTDFELNAKSQRLWKIVSYDDGETWSTREQVLETVDEPHIHYQILSGWEKDEDGFSKEVIIPVHHLDETVTSASYQMVWRCNRAIDPQDGSWSVVNMSNSSDLDLFGGYIQASIVRPNGGKNLVAFLRDGYGRWMGQSRSNDDGRSWMDVYEMPIPNADLMSQAIWLHNDRVMLVYNPQQSFGSANPDDRDDNDHILVVALSENEGLSWQYSRTLEYAYDGMHLYPVGLQDPTCNNVYLTYSMRTNEKQISCSSDLDWPACVEHRTTVNLIKFTILHESWVENDHNWKYDYDGCTWEIAPELQTKIPTFPTLIPAESFLMSSISFRLTKSSSQSLVVVLTVLISVTLICSFGLLLYRIFHVVRDRYVELT